MPIFDRFIRYAWTEHALELAAQGKLPNSLKDWLISAGVKGESARRTATSYHGCGSQKKKTPGLCETTH